MPRIKGRERKKTRVQNRFNKAMISEKKKNVYSKPGGQCKKYLLKMTKSL